MAGFIRQEEIAIEAENVALRAEVARLRTILEQWRVEYAVPHWERLRASALKPAGRPRKPQVSPRQERNRELQEAARAKDDVYQGTLLAKAEWNAQKEKKKREER